MGIIVACFVVGFLSVFMQKTLYFLYNFNSFSTFSVIFLIIYNVSVVFLSVLLLKKTKREKKNSKRKLNTLLFFLSLIIGFLIVVEICFFLYQFLSFILSSLNITFLINNVTILTMVMITKKFPLLIPIVGILFITIGLLYIIREKNILEIYKLKKSKKNISIFILIIIVSLVLSVLAFNIMGVKSVNQYNENLEKYTSTCQDVKEKDKEFFTLTEKYLALSSYVQNEEFVPREFLEESIRCGDNISKVTTKDELNDYSKRGIGPKALKRKLSSLEKKLSGLEEDIKKEQEKIDELESPLTKYTKEELKKETFEDIDSYKQDKDGLNKDLNNETRTFGPATLKYKGTFYLPEETDSNNFKIQKIKIYYEISYDKTESSETKKVKENYVYDYTIVDDGEEKYVVYETGGVRFFKSFDIVKENLLDNGYKEYIE